MKWNITILDNTDVDRIKNGAVQVNIRQEVGQFKDLIFYVKTKN